MAGAGAVAPAAAAPQAHLGTPLACLPAHLPVPTAREAELLRRMDALTINTSPECMQLSEREKQLLQILEDLSLDSADARDALPDLSVLNGTTAEACSVAATSIQAHFRGHWTRSLLQAACMLQAVHVIQQACYNFVMCCRVASLAPYTLSDKGLPSNNLRMQSVRPTLAPLRAVPRSSRCRCVRRSCEGTKPPPAPRRRGSAPGAQPAQRPSSSASLHRMHAVASCLGRPGWWRPSSRRCSQ